MRSLHRSGRPQPTEVPVAEVDPTVSEHDTKEAGFTQDRKDSSSDDEISKDAQGGVQKMEAVTKVWSRWHLVTAYAL
jgi:hypothetical protein